MSPVTSPKRIAVIGPHIPGVLGRPVESIPPGQGSARLAEVRVTAAGAAAGTAVDLAKISMSVAKFGSVGADLLGDKMLSAMTTGHRQPTGH